MDKTTNNRARPFNKSRKHPNDVNRTSMVSFNSMKKALENLPNFDPDFFNYSKKNDGEIQAESLYSANVWVYAACTAITTNLLQLPKALDLASTAEKELNYDDPLLDKLKHPNTAMSSQAFWETTYLNLLLPTKHTKGGQCFWIMDSGTGKPVNLTKGEIPREIFPFSDEFIDPVQAKDGSLEGWKLSIPGQEPTFFDVTEVVRMNLTDPRNMFRGQAPIWPALLPVKLDNATDTMNKHFFDNDASLGGVLMTEAEMDKIEVDAMTEQWEAKYKGKDKAGKTAVLHSGLRFEQFKRSHKDMLYIDQKKWTRDQILAVYRVPKAEVSIYEDMNYATAKQADRSFWTKTLLPYDYRILSMINDQWIRFYQKGKYELISDLGVVEALSEDFTSKLEQAKKLFEMHVPLAEINRRLELNLDLAKYEWTQTALVPLSIQPAENVGKEPAEDNTNITLPEEEEEEETSNEEDEDKQAPTLEDAINELEKSFKKLKEKEIKSRYLDTYYKTTLRPDEVSIGKVLDKYLVKQRNMVLDLVDEWKKSKNKKAILKKEKEEPEENFKIELKAENLRLAKALFPEYKKMQKSELAAMEMEITGIEWDADLPSAKKIIIRRINKVVKINKTTFGRAQKQVKEVFKEAFDHNWTVEKIADELKIAIRKVYKERMTSNTKTIARTETGIIHAESRYDIMKNSDVKEIEWITAHDNDVRNEKDSSFPHDILDGSVIKLGEFFNNGENIRFPKDSHASAGNIINCRCTYVSHKGKK